MNLVKREIGIDKIRCISFFRIAGWVLLDVSLWEELEASIGKNEKMKCTRNTPFNTNMNFFSYISISKTIL